MHQVEKGKKNIRILLAEDDKAISEVVSIILEDEGYDVTILDKGQVLISTLAKQQYHLLLLDLSLSGADGGVLCRKIKENPKTSTLPIIILSANMNIREIAEKNKADDVLEKPFDIDILLEKVKKFVE